MTELYKKYIFQYMILTALVFANCNNNVAQHQDAQDVENDSIFICHSDSDCDDINPCTTDNCDIESNICINDIIDSDGDSYVIYQVSGVICGTDCDDNDYTIHPYAAPDCAGNSDFNCDGLNDKDNDMDGFISYDCGGDDCNDDNNEIHPTAIEVCNDGVDEDCDGLIDYPILAIDKVKLFDEVHDSPVHDVTWTGSELIVSWCDSDNILDVETVYMSRYSINGLQIGETMINNNKCQGKAPAITWSGEDIGIVEYNEDGLIMIFQSYNEDLLLDSPQIELIGYWPNGIGYNNGIYYVTSHISTSPTTVYINQIDETTWGNSVIETGFRIDSTMSIVEYNCDIGIAFSGDYFGITGCLTLWMPHDNEFSAYYQRITTEGNNDVFAIGVGPVFDLAERYINSIQNRTPDILWNGTVFITGVEDIITIDPSSNIILSIRGIEDHRNNTPPSITWSGSNIGIAYINIDTTTEEMTTFASILDTEGNPIYDKIQISTSGRELRNPIISWMDISYGISWHERDEDGNWAIYYSRIDMCD